MSKLSFEPKVAVNILQEMVKPWEDSGNLKIFYRTQATACEMDAETGNRIVAVTAQSTEGATYQFFPHTVLDATDTGELLALCGTEGKDWVVGAESQAETGEPDAPPEPRPQWVQPFTFPFALKWSPQTAATNVITPPEDYDALKALQKYHVKHGSITGLFAGKMPWWSYRRLLAAENFHDPQITTDLAMINTQGNDYYGGNILGADAGDSTQISATLARARRAALGYVYWLQTECPREEARPPTPNSGGETVPSFGYPEFRLRFDVFDTPDGCSPKPYIRESRRIKAVRPILEQEIVAQDFRGNDCRGEKARSAFMSDTVGVGSYPLDIHPNGHGEPNAFVTTRPFQIPLGALIPVRLTNLLPACKNLGTTHLSNGAYRLHPIEWNIGESAGLIAHFCLQKGLTLRELSQNEKTFGELQSFLLHNRIPLHWYTDVPLEHPAFFAVQKLASTGVALGSETDLLFHPDDPITPEDWNFWRDATGSLAPATFTGSRAEAASTLFGGGDNRTSVESS